MGEKGSRIIKYTHFFFVESGIYNYEFVSMIDRYFDYKEHRFVFASKLNYEQCVEFEKKGFDCVYDSGIMNMGGLEKYYLDTDFVFWHSKPFGIKELFYFKICYAKKTIWCIWGHDLYDTSNNRVMIRIRQISSRLLNRKVPSFRTIVAGFESDSKEVIKRYGSKVNLYNAVYPQGHSETELNAVKAYRGEKKDIRILIGHSSCRFLQHEKYLKKLLPYRERVRLVLPLNYGDMEYGNEVENIAKKLWGNKVEIYREFMTSSRYLEILKGVDAAVFDYKHQAAYGNILILLYFKIRCYLAVDGVMLDGLKNQGVEVYDCEEIETHLNNNEIKRKCGQYNIDWAKKNLCTEMIEKQWRELFQKLMDEN